MKPILSVFVILLFVRASAQTGNDRLTYCNEDWKETKQKKATFLLCERHTNDTTHQWIYYNNNGPRIRIESYKDRNKSVLHGRYAHYYPDGNIDSAGNYSNGKQDGIWVYRAQDGKSYHRRKYKHGILLYDSAFKIFKGPKNRDSIPGEVESEFAGGLPAWQRYLNKNLHYPQNAIDHEVMGEVRIQFIVDKDGAVVEPDISKSVEYSLDEESLRVIRPTHWTPAVKDGIPVRSYKIQPIVYKLEIEDGRRR